MIGKRGGDSPVQLDGGTLFFFGGLGAALMGGSSAVGVPVGLGLETPLPMVLLSVPCFAVFVIGTYALAAVFVSRLPLPEVRFTGKQEKITTGETGPGPGPGPNPRTDPADSKVEAQLNAMARALIKDSKGPSKHEQKNEG